MSIKDNNKVIIISNAMTGEIIIQIPFDQKLWAEDYIHNIIMYYIATEEGLLIKIGNRA